jgi:Acyltransferase family
LAISNQHIGAIDLIRTSAILIVFFHHFLTKEPVGSIVKSITPGMGLIGLSLLGFISSLLTTRENFGDGLQMLRRMLRIYIPLFLCLTVVLFLYNRVMDFHFGQHALLHYMGLTAFFQLFGVKSGIFFSDGLWFITTIVVLYFISPIFSVLFSHKNRVGHLLICAACFSILDFVMYGHANIFNVATGFAFGVFIQKTEYLPRLIKMHPAVYIPSAVAILAVNILSAYEAFPVYVHSFFYIFYPVIFVPIFYKLSSLLPKSIMKLIGYFSVISYEFYILHFYFISKTLYSDILDPNGIIERISLAFGITTVLSVALSWIGTIMRKSLESYIMGGMICAQNLFVEKKRKKRMRQCGLTAA